MSRDYGRIVPSFWTGQTAREGFRGDLATWSIASYLITGPHSHATGVYYLPPAYIAHDLGIDQIVVETTLLKLERLGFVDLDRPSDWIFVREMARIQIGEVLKPSDKRVKWVVKEIAKAPGNLQAAFRRRYEGAFNLPEAPSHGASASIRQEQEQEQEQERRRIRSRAFVLWICPDQNGGRT